MVRGIALFLTVLTGFSGLVYQVAWQKFLASLLGSHSEATAAVLGIFLGGLSLGYALFGAVTRRIVAGSERPPLLLWYGGVEAAIGLYALVFPFLFAGMQALSLRLPHSADGFAFAVDVGLTALLIGPPTVLMGGTIPLLTQGLARSVADATRFHALVYAFNTLGAFAGALAAGFFLVPWLGLDSTVTTMGGVNLIAGLGFFLLHARASGDPAPAAEPAAAAPATESGGPAGSGPLAAPAGFAALCAAVLLAGFAMMTLQTVMNRIGALALGASHFTFSMIVATFVLCIAVGSFAVSALRRIRPRTLVVTQWLLVAYLLGLYAWVEEAPYWTYALRRTWFGGDDFYAFHFAFFLATLAVFAIPLGLSGSLLPLLFHHLRRQLGDLGSMAGRIYSWNTVGSLLGALLGGYTLLFWLDLDQTYRIAVVALAGAAAISGSVVFPRRRWASALLAAGVAVAVSLQAPWDPKLLFAGLFRHHAVERPLGGSAEEFTASLYEGWRDDFVLFADDDPTASVAVFEIAQGDEIPRRSIVSNGKSDGNVPGDNMTTGLLALLPALFADRCEKAFVIGYGTGMTVGELAALESTREVVVAEISQGVIDAAPLFEGYNRNALASPKTRIVRSDAYRALLRSEDRYDVIVSEPSNPWVTGVEMLYSRDFLQAARGRLAPGGVYAQWFHTYETDDASVALVLGTFRSVFDRVSVWRGRHNDLILLGFEDSETQVDLPRLLARWSRPDFRRQLADLSIRSFPRLLAHEALPLGVLAEIPLPEPVHTIQHPILSHATARAFFAGSDGHLPESLARDAATVGALNSLWRHYRVSRGADFSDEDRLELLRETCQLDSDRCATLFAQWLNEAPDSETLATSLERARTSPRFGGMLRPEVLVAIASLFHPDAGDAPPPSFETASALAAVFARYYHHAAPFHPAALHGPWARCAVLDPRCAARIDGVLARGLALPRVSQR